MIYVFMGPPAAGKDTQAELLAQKLDWPAVDTGSLLRELAKTDGRVAEMLANGTLFPPEYIRAVFVQVHGQYPDNIILNGAFRLPEQVDAIFELWDKKKIVAILLEANPEVLVARTLHRIAGSTEHRSDDTLTTLQKRIDRYEATLPSILAHLTAHGIPLHRINAEGDIETIHQTILAQIQTYAYST